MHEIGGLVNTSLVQRCNIYTSFVCFYLEPMAPVGLMEAVNGQPSPVSSAG